MADLLKSFKVYTGGGGGIGPVTRQTQQQNLQNMGFTSSQQAAQALASGLVTVSKEVKNNAGGYVFAIDDLARARRFIVLGSDKGTYYQGAVDLLKQNLDCFRQLIAANRHQELVDMIADVSVRGLVPKQDTLIFALAWLSCQPQSEVRAAVFAVLPSILRTPTDQFAFIFKWRKSIRESMGQAGPGWGRAMRRVFKDQLYLKTPVQQLAYQVTKYQSRDGVSQRDVLRLIHPAVGGKRKRDGTPTTDLDPARNLLFAWAVGGGKLNDEMEQTYYELVSREKTAEEGGGGEDAFQILPYLKAVHEALRTEDPSRAVELIKGWGLVREQISTSVLKEVSVWGALLESMPMTALLRNLASMTAKGVFCNSDYLQNAVATLTNDAAIRKSRVHPMTIYLAIKQYASGKGDKGSLRWVPERGISAALQYTLKTSFKFGTPTGKKILVALDVSGSMSSSMSQLGISAREASAVMSLAFVHAGDPVEFVAFQTSLTPLVGVTTRTYVEDFTNLVSRLDFGATDCAQPMLYAIEKRKYDIDAFVVFTDSETYAGRCKPFEALAHYSLQSKKTDAKLVVCGLTSTGFSIADPKNPNMLDVVGLDSSVPQLVANFISGVI